MPLLQWLSTSLASLLQSRGSGHHFQKQSGFFPIEETKLLPSELLILPGLIATVAERVTSKATKFLVLN